MRSATVISLAAMLCLGASADPLEVVFQEGLEGYQGTEDFMMYAPSSVAFVNYGQGSGLTAGINRWGEHYASIIRFDLRGIPPGSRVLGGKLQLYHRSADFPWRPVTVDLHELTAANADWTEGTGDGTRVPTPGAPCWTYRRHDTDRWAGAGGARQPDVDFSTAWSSQAEAAAKAAAWLEFEIPASAAQRWIDDPATNAGLHLWPAMASEKGDVVYFCSSEHEEEEHRPRLVLTLERSDALASALNRDRVTRMITAARERHAEVSRYAAEQGTPAGTAATLAEVEEALGRLGASLRDAEAVDNALAGRMTTQVAAQLDRLTAAYLGMPADRAREWNEGRGLATDFALGVASSMEKVFRRDSPFGGEFTDTVTIRLARNEHEGAQIVVVPIDADLQAVTWRLSGLAADGVAATVRPVGYVRQVRPQLPSDSSPSEWWPDPLLDFLQTFDVPRGEAQPLWLDVHASEEAPARTFSGELTVEAQGLEPKTITIQVSVFDFSVPVEQHLRTIWGMSEGNFGKFHGDDYDDELAWRYFDLFLDHRLAVTDLYRTKPTGVAGEDSIYHLANVEAMKRLRARGSGWWNVGYVLAPKWALQEERGFGVDTYEAYLAKCVEMFREELVRVRAADWPPDRVGIYFLDETSNFEALAQAAEVMKTAFPDIPLMTTGYDRSYGLGDGTVAKWMDIWVPLTPRYHEDRENILQGRELGKQAWWYICVGPRDRGALNWFVQYPTIRARLLMGLAARKYRPDGFLYYRVVGWNNNEEPITTGPYTDWDPHYHETLPDGDGMIICGGPDGPLSTMRLENIRDGLEDYEYYWVLDDLLARCAARELAPPARAIVERARELQEVPDELLASLAQYTESPGELRAHREKLGATIQQLQAICAAP